jgi:chemotaxis protein MotB
MSLTGHTDASPAETGRVDYTNWELSSDRAQTARRFLTKSGLEAERAKKVVGMADRELYIPQQPRSPKNRRVSIIMLRGSHILIPDGAVPKEAAPEPVAAPEAPAPASAAEPAAAH